MTTKAKRITWITVSAVLAALLITVVILFLPFAKVNDGFNTDAKPYMVQVAKNGSYSEIIPGAYPKHSQKENYEGFIKNYHSMTSFSIMRGIFEGRWFPKAKLADVVRAGDIDVRPPVETEEGQPATDWYVVIMDFQKPQTAQMKVKKGTKDEPNSVEVRGDGYKPNTANEPGDQPGEYKEGEKVSFSFTRITFAVTDNNFINELTVYAFDLNSTGDSEFNGYKISVQANQKKLYEACKALFG